MAYKALKPRLAKQLAEKGEMRARSKIRSNQLRRGLYKRVSTQDPSRWALIVPHFWATYIHDGRGPVRPTTARLLVWFRNPKDDPRLFNGNSPISRSQTRRMTKAEFQKWSRINREKIQAYKRATGKKILTQGELESLKLPMIVAKVSGATRLHGTKVYPFFSNSPGGGMAGFKEEARAFVKPAVNDHVLKSLKDAGLVGYKKTITVRI